MLKEFLLTPGPTTIPARVFKAMEQSVIHHRTPVFERQFKQALEGMRKLLDAEQDPIFLAASGSGAMEATLLNLCNSQDKVISINAGAFGERWGKIAEKLQLNHIEIKAEWGDSPRAEVLEKVLREHRDAKVFCLQYCETSTAALLPVPEISALVHSLAPEMLVVVDAISALVTVPLSQKKLQLDVVIAASQKALMLQPGLSMLSLSSRAWERVAGQKVRSLYFDLLAERKAHKESTTAWTPAIGLILALNESLSMIEEEGLDAVHLRHAQNARATRDGLQALGFTLLSAEFPCPGVTAAFPPAGVDAETFRSKLLNDHGVRIAGGQGKLKDRIIRVGHMGYVDKIEILGALSAMELTICALQSKQPRGLANSAALNAYTV